MGFNMRTSRALRFTPRQRRAFVSYLFGATAFASILTVSASDVLPCPAHVTRARFADSEEDGRVMKERRQTVVEKRPRRWIEEKNPNS
ncbi:hypothetical protein QCA50_000321 [Cerrena zonata]|uniref:Transmembrane protein n=1 Tax=Cerrena zonata TaxID=2478898 RepID=A0AAW0GR22_9APHY